VRPVPALPTPPARPASYADRLPAQRPPGLRLTVSRRTWHRLDAAPAQDWSWDPFPSPRYRFDSASGAVRVRYAGSTVRSAMRERFDDTGRHLAAAHLDVHLVEIAGTLRVLDLRLERNLDALGLDDQVSTARSPEVWQACQRLTDLATGWYGDRLDAIVYRSRTTPQTSANLAFVRPDPQRVTVRDLGPLRAHDALLATCVLSDGFAIDGW
jgi:hypothetical protein